MTHLEFHVEWEDAPQVRSPVLAATWARLEIRIDGRPVTRFWSEAVNAIRSGVYGSVFPLAQWIAGHWWHLLDEGFPHPDVLLGGRRGRARSRAWLARHNLVFARDGMAYPDLSIYREDTLVALSWVPDPEDVTTPGRFIGVGAAHVSRGACEAGLARLVESVLERTADLDADEVLQLRADWAAISSSSGDERVLCSRLAGLGLDPYAPDPDEAVEQTLSSDLRLSESVIHDLLAATAPDHLDADLQAARLLIERLPSVTDVHPLAVDDLPYDPRPYRAGYRRAETVRNQLGIDPGGPLLDLPAVIEHLFGTVPQTWIATGGPAIEAAVERNGVCALAASMRPLPAQRFLLGRAIHHWQFVTHGASAVRLLTRSGDWLQSASRAFAAELLVPAAALSARLAGERGWDLQQQLADEFQVSPMVIAHQLENHGLG